MPRYTAASFRRPIIVDPLKEPVDLTSHTTKIFPLIATPGNERFAFVYEQASYFHRRLPDGRIEKVPKRKGSGFAGGGSKVKANGVLETPVETGIREGNEELGTEEKTLERLVGKDNVTYTVYAGDSHPFHLIHVPVSEKDFKKGFINRGAITDWKLVGKKAGWARLRALWETIIAPENFKEREMREERGSAWFYYGHQVLLAAMLVTLVRKGALQRTQADLPQIVFRQFSPLQGFSLKMVEMLVRESREDLLEDRLPRLAHSEKLSRRAASALVANRQDVLVERVVAQADRKWRRELEHKVTRFFEIRDKKEQPHVFGSLEEMLAFHEGMEEGEVDEHAAATADTEIEPVVFNNMDEMLMAITFDEEED